MEGSHTHTHVTSSLVHIKTASIAAMTGSIYIAAKRRQFDLFYLFGSNFGSGDGQNCGLFFV